MLTQSTSNLCRNSLLIRSSNEETEKQAPNGCPKNTLWRAALLKHGSRRMSKKYTLEGRALETCSLEAATATDWKIKCI